MNNFYEDLGIIDEESRKRIDEVTQDPNVIKVVDEVVQDYDWFKKNKEYSNINPDQNYLDIEERMKKAIDKLVGIEEENEEKEEVPSEPLPDEITIRIPNWYKLHRPYDVTLHTGVTILVGKNGSGKTTFIKQIEEYCKENKYKYFSYSDVTNGRHNSMSSAAFYGRYNQLSTLFSDSEGQRVFDNFSFNLGKMGKFIRKAPKYKPSFILLDAIDSGLSIDLIREIKEFLTEVLIPDIEEFNKKIYVIITTNQYEFTIGFPCINVKNGKYIEFKTYNSYTKFICKPNRKRKKNND